MCGCVVFRSIELASTESVRMLILGGEIRREVGRYSIIQTRSERAFSFSHLKAPQLKLPLFFALLPS